MGIKKRSKVSAEFSMSSLTDIIFLLLIFFMLTSNLVAPNALNLKLPGKGNPTTASSDPTDVTINKTGTFYLNGKKVSKGKLEAGLRNLKRANRKLDITITSDGKTPIEYTVEVMDIAQRLEIATIMVIDE